jgi:hypothetical protein
MIQPVTDLPLLTWAQFKQQLTEAGIPLELAQKTIQEGLEKFAKMKADPASVVSSAVNEWLNVASMWKSVNLHKPYCVVRYSCQPASNSAADTP